MPRLSAKEIKDQSENTLKQWLPKWEAQAKENARWVAESNTTHKELVMMGTGRTAVVCAMGASFETQIPILRKYANMQGIDFICVDKALGPLMENGIRPRFTFIADGNVSYEKYCEKWAGNTQGMNLVCNVSANPKWPANWAGKRYFYVNKDNIKSEVSLAELSGCHEAIPASSNVGNTAIVFLLQLLNYDRIMLVGYDFCWKPDGNYYAYEWAADKRSFMHHIDLIDQGGNLVFSSTNLQFSAKWLTDFLSGTGSHHVRDCSKGILAWHNTDLDSHLDMVVRSGGVRKWNDHEKQDFIQVHRQEVALGINQFDQLEKLLKQPGMTTLNVSLSGVATGVVQFLEAQ